MATKRPIAAPLPAATQHKTSAIAEEIFANADADKYRGVVNAKAALDKIADMAKLFRDADDAVNAAEEELKRRKAHFLKIEREDFPELLRESGFEELTLSDGTKVKLADEISCGITEDKSSECHAWLRDHELGSVIKTLVSVSFGKDEVAQADKLFVRLLATFGDRVAQTEKVHPQTLKALLKELMAKEVPFPLELFGVQPYSVAKITQAKVVTKGKAVRS